MRFKFTINSSYLILILGAILCNGLLSYRLEPMNIHKIREQFYSDNFNHFTNSLKLEYNIDKGYYCNVKQNIYSGDEVFKMPRNFTYTTFDEFPLKHKLFDTVRENEFVRSNLNLTGNLLLVTRLLFDLKANVTEVFILMKKYEREKETTYDFQNFKSYLKSRNDFFFNFLKNLPLANIYGQTSWSDDDVNDYELTGFLPVFKNQLVKIYSSLKESFQKDKILNEFTKNWFNDSNLVYFLSIYGYVISRSFRISLNDYGIINDINKEIEKTGGSILIPFIDLCNHYHPKLINQEDSKAQLKLIKINFDKENVKIQALSEYKSSEEFTFSYSNLLTNDYLLLNYGFIIKNNPFQEFVFRFDIDDPNYNFYTKLKSENFNTNQIAIVENEKLAIHFPLLFNKISLELLKFIKIFLELNNYLENEKHTKMKIYQKLTETIKVNNLNLLKTYMLYYTTIEKNIKTMFDSLDNKNIDVFVENMRDTEKKKEKLTNIIEENTRNFILSRNLTNGVDDDLQNLFYFKTLHSYIKRSLIQHFNFENLKILYSQQDLALKHMISLYRNNLNSLKNNYID